MTQNAARKELVRERMKQTGENYTTAARRLNQPTGLIHGPHLTGNGPDDAEVKTWTFMGHWNDAGRIEVEYFIEGTVQDERKDTGYWSGGLWAASASGRTVEEAEAAAIAEYEDDDEYLDDPNDVILVPYQVVVDVRVNIKTGEIVEVRTIDETLEPHATLDVVTPTELNRVDAATEARAREIAETTEWPAWR